jgi:hypothetical protein
LSYSVHTHVISKLPFDDIDDDVSSYVILEIKEGILWLYSCYKSLLCEDEIMKRCLHSPSLCHCLLFV